MNVKDVLRVILLVDRMRENAASWHDADQDEKKRLFEENQDLARTLVSVYNIPAVYNQDDGTWSVWSVNGPKLFDLY